jgi:predicted O-linked N-acetylglucosamine transferase (SPINDLY family)
MNVLRRVPRALLLLLVPSDFARRNILAQVAAHGISSSRIVFLSKVRTLSFLFTSYHGIYTILAQ